MASISPRHRSPVVVPRWVPVGVIRDALPVKGCQQIFPVAIPIGIGMLFFDDRCRAILDPPRRQVPCIVVIVLIPLLCCAICCIFCGILHLSQLIIGVGDIAVILQIRDPRDVVPHIIRIPVPRLFGTASLQGCVIGFRQSCGCSCLASCQVGVVLIQDASHSTLCQAGQVIIAVRDPAVGEQRHPFQRAFSYIAAVFYHLTSVPIIIKAFCRAVNYSGDRITHPGQSVVGIVLIRRPQLCRTSCLARTNQSAYGIIVVGISDRAAAIFVRQLI